MNILKRIRVWWTEKWHTTGEIKYSYEPLQNGYVRRYLMYQEVDVCNKGRYRWVTLESSRIMTVAAAKNDDTGYEKMQKELRNELLSSLMYGRWM